MIPTFSTLLREVACLFFVPVRVAGASLVMRFCMTQVT